MSQTGKNSPATQETWVQSLGWDDPMKEDMATHSSVSTWSSPMDRGAWRATVHWVTKGQTQLKWLSTAYLYSLMKNNSHTMLFSHLKYIIQQFLVYSHSCTESVLEHFITPSPDQRNFFSLAVIPHSCPPFPPLPALGNPQSSLSPADLPTRDVSHKWNYTLCGFCDWASFSCLDVFKVHFIAFYC